MYEKAYNADINEFVLELVNNSNAKFERDFATVKGILEKETINENDRKTLLSIYRPSYHDSGKIEGITSFDSTATNCDFCAKMRKQAENNNKHICGYCYDYAQEHSFRGANIVNRHTLNMLIMSSVDFSVDELKTLNATYINRINSSGDVPNVIYARNMLKIMNAFSDFRFAFWAKNTAPVIKACDEIGKPKNCILIQSSIIIGKPATLAKYFDYVFTVYVTKEETEKAIENGANECNGKKCKACGYSCYFGKFEKGANIAEFLRVNKETREKILA